MPIIKYEPTFAELVDNAAQRRVEEVERWNQTIYLIYGSKIDPFSSFLRKLGGDIEPNKVIEGDVEVKPSILLKISAVAYLFVNGPFSYPRSIVICFMLLTLVFRLADATLQERTASLSYYLDTIINIIFIIEGFLRLLTLPVTLETRKNNKEQIRSLTYEILRCGWIEIILSIGSLILIRKLNSSNAICWINYFRMTFISKFFLSESPQVEVILVCDSSKSLLPHHRLEWNSKWPTLCHLNLVSFDGLLCRVWCSNHFLFSSQRPCPFFDGWNRYVYTLPNIYDGCKSL